jgi:hypothetical protein
VSAVVKITLSFLPFKYVLKWLGKVNVESESGPNIQTSEIRQDLKVAIRLCDRYVFWKTECYTQSLTGKILLKQLGIQSTIYVGFFKSSKGLYKAHAWLRSYDSFVTGYLEKDEFEIQYYFT